MITMDNVLTIHPYNDLGLLARGKLIVLAEAQSTWSVNIIFRLADYYFDSAMSYLKIRKADLHSSVKVDVPDVEAFVIYTGRNCIGGARKKRTPFWAALRLLCAQNFVSSCHLTS